MAKKKPTEIVCILDRSGSMHKLTKEVIGGFNSFIEQQRKLDDPANVTLILFDDRYEKVYERVPLKDVPELTERVYYTRGMTALNDAIGITLNEFDRKAKNVIVLIQTDGEENSSQEFYGLKGRDQIRALVKEKEALGWSFVFVGAGIDAFQASSGYGMRGQSVNTTQDAEGTSVGYRAMTDAALLYRTQGSVKK